MAVATTPEEEDMKRDATGKTSHNVLDGLEAEDDDDDCPCCDRVEPWLLLPKTPANWVVFCLFYAANTALVLWFFIYAFPRLVNNTFTPAVDSIQDRLTPVQIGTVVCVAVATIPATVLLPREPFIWVAAAIFTLPEAFVIVEVGNIVGMIIPFVLTRIWLHRHLFKFFKRYKYTKAMLLSLRKAGPFTTVLILRLGPVPPPWTSYLMGIPKEVRFWPYITASILGSLPNIIVGVIFGRNIKGLAAMLQGQAVPVSQLVVSVVSLVAAVILLLGGFLYAKRALAQLQAEAEQAGGQDEDTTAAGNECTGQAEETIKPCFAHAIIVGQPASESPAYLQQLSHRNPNVTVVVHEDLPTPSGGDAESKHQPPLTTSRVHGMQHTLAALLSSQSFKKNAKLT